MSLVFSHKIISMLYSWSPNTLMSWVSEMFSCCCNLHQFLKTSSHGCYLIQNVPHCTNWEIRSNWDSKSIIKWIHGCCLMWSVKMLSFIFSRFFPVLSTHYPITLLQHNTSYILINNILKRLCQCRWAAPSFRCHLSHFLQRSDAVMTVTWPPVMGNHRIADRCNVRSLNKVAR